MSCSSLARSAHYYQKNKKFCHATAATHTVYFLSCFGDRLWWFALAAFIHPIGGLGWIALQQFVDSFAKFMLSPKVGQKLDEYSRIRGIRTVLLVNNTSIVISAGLLSVALGDELEASTRHGLLALAILINAAGQVASSAQKTGFTKDWIYVLVQNSSLKANLETHNTIASSIDQVSVLSTNLLGGYLMDKLGSRSCCYLFIAWNIVSGCIEAYLAHCVYRANKCLHIKESKPSANEGMFGSYKVYIKQSCFPAAFGLALLYFTVLGFDNLAIGYAISQGMPMLIVGVFRFTGGFLGLLGTLSFAVLARKLPLVTVTIIGLALQNMSIWVTVASTFMPGTPFHASEYFANNTLSSWLDEAWNTLTVGKPDNNPDPTWAIPLHLIIFFIGIMLARYGLWMADSSIMQHLQEVVPESDRNNYFNTQTAICELFSILKDIGVFLLPHVSTFGVLARASAVFVFLGFCFNFYYYQKHRRDKVEKKPPEVEPMVLGTEEEMDALVEEAPLQTSRTDQL